MKMSYPFMGLKHAPSLQRARVKALNPHIGKRLRGDWHVKCLPIHEPVVWWLVPLFGVAFAKANFDSDTSVDQCKGYL